MLIKNITHKIKTQMRRRVPPAITAQVQLVKTTERISIKFEISGTYTKLYFIQ
jgi:hypothetical protein